MFKRNQIELIFADITKTVLYKKKIKKKQTTTTNWINVKKKTSVKKSLAVVVYLCLLFTFLMNVIDRILSRSSEAYAA